LKASKSYGIILILTGQMKRASIIILLGVSLFYGCAADSGVVRTERGTFVVSRASNGVSGPDELKAESVEEARAYCERSGQSLQVVDVRGSKPPYYLTNLPQIKVEFMCPDRQGLDSIVRAR